jgi:hypothetical protein
MAVRIQRGGRLTMNPVYRSGCRRTVAAVTLLCAVLTATAAAQPVLQCSGAQKPWMVAELLFGRSKVSDRSWERFLTAEVTPRFPDGLTVYDAKGQWRNPETKTISRERSTVVMIAMPPGADNDVRLQAVIEAYKIRFKQQSVGLILRPSCVSF